MALGLYKPGQGYWVRVMTAALASVIILAACGWIWAQARLVPIPVPRWTLTVAPGEGAAAPAAGATLALISEAGAAIGSGEVLAVTPAGTTLDVRIGRIRMSEGAVVSQAAGVGTPGVAGAPPTQWGRVTAKTGEPAVQPLYVQAGAALVILIIGTGFVYWFVGVKPRTAEFLIATDGEMRKVNWSTRKGIIDSTWVVILWSVLLAAGLFLVDFAFSQVFTLIGVLQRE